MRPCPTCPALISNDQQRCGKCASRRRRAERRRRPRTDAHSNDPAWRDNSKRFLKANPECVQCGKQATVADHIIPRRVLIARSILNPDAWHWLQPLCKEHHDRKTATVDGGFGRTIILET